VHYGVHYDLAIDHSQIDPSDAPHSVVLRRIQIADVRSIAIQDPRWRPVRQRAGNGSLAPHFRHSGRRNEFLEAAGGRHLDIAASGGPAEVRSASSIKVGPSPIGYQPGSGERDSVHLGAVGAHKHPHMGQITFWTKRRRRRRELACTGLWGGKTGRGGQRRREVWDRGSNAKRIRSRSRPKGRRCPLAF
jgi:hypothetical protein